MLRIHQLLSLGLLAVLSACSHSSSPDNPVAPPPPADTLTAGWTRLAAPSPNINDVFFADNQLGYVATGNSLFRSSDAGSTWTAMTLTNPGNGNPFINIGARGQKSAFTSSSYFIHYSVNGNVVNAQSYNSPLGLPGISDVFFASADTVFFSSGQYIWRSLTGGADADTVYNFGTSTGIENPLYFINGNTGWVLRAGLLYRTTNGGAGWTAGFNFYNPASGGAIQFLNAQQGFFTVNGRLYRSDDGGATATLVRDFGGGYYADLHFFDMQTGYVSHGRYIYRTSDGGATWTTVVTVGSGGIIEIHFSDATHGWAAGYDGVLLRFRP